MKTTTVEMTATLAKIIEMNSRWYEDYYLFLHHDVLMRFGNIQIKYVDFVSNFVMIQHHDMILLATGNLDADL